MIAAFEQNTTPLNQWVGLCWSMTVYLCSLTWDKIRKPWALVSDQITNASVQCVAYCDIFQSPWKPVLHVFSWASEGNAQTCLLVCSLGESPGLIAIAQAKANSPCCTILGDLAVKSAHAAYACRPSAPTATPVKEGTHGGNTSYACAVWQKKKESGPLPENIRVMSEWKQIFALMWVWCEFPVITLINIFWRQLLFMVYAYVFFNLEGCG